MPSISLAVALIPVSDSTAELVRSKTSARLHSLLLFCFANSKDLMNSFNALTSIRLLSARRLNTELTKSKELIEDLNSFEKTMPIGAEASNGADLLSLLGQRRRIRQAKEQRVKARRRRLLQRINNIEIDKR